MKNPVLIILATLLLASCNNGNKYRIEVLVENPPDSVMVHNHWYVGNDTVEIIGGKCVFEGEVDSFPTLVSIGFPFPSQEKTRLILEPGRIEVSYTPDERYRIGGTRNNVILQSLFDELKPLEEEVKQAWKNWNEVYKMNPRSKDDCEKAWFEQEALKLQKDELTRRLIRENPNYAGLVISLPLVRYENAGNLGLYVDHFREFEGDKRYESIVNQYVIADRTVNGKAVPAFTFPDPAGENVSLDDFKGKWVLLDFWYVDCHWCRKLTPHLINIYDEWREEKNFEIISISVDKPKDYYRWLEAIEHDGAQWTQVNDSTKTYPLEYGITGYPTMILVDPDGNGVKKIVGYQEEGGLRRILGEHF